MIWSLQKFGLRWRDRHFSARTSGLAVFLYGMVITGVTVAVLALTTADRDYNEFMANASNAEDLVLDRVETSIALLRGTAGLFSSHEEAVTVSTFRAYVERLALSEQYPGILGIGFSRRVPPDKVSALEEEMRRQGLANFRIWPDQPRDELHSIIFLEPLGRRNRAAIGYDMYTDATRRTAMARARDTGKVAASGVVELVQEIDEHKQPGFLIYLPVYEGGTIPSAVDERRSRLAGFAYAPIRAGDFLSSAFSHLKNPRIHVEVYHGRSPNAASLLFEHGASAAGPPRFTLTSSVDVAGEPWTLVVQSRTTLAHALIVPLLAALAGIALSLLLAVVVSRETRARAAAEGAFERERLARAEAERANAMKDQFLATLSHELRTPINAIVGWASLLKQMMPGNPRAGEAIEVIDRNAKAQVKLIEDLLDMNGIITGKLRMDMEPVNIVDVINDALATMAPAAQAKGIVIERSVDVRPMTVRGDAARLKQIVANLLSNAVKFTPSGGRVTVSLQRDEAHVRIVVVDTGDGIETSALERIFDRFSQADGSITRKHGGLGLGLAIVRHLVTLHGGTVRADSAGIGFGATFTVELPLIESTTSVVAVAPGASFARHSLAGLKVLVVDDERDARELIRFVLEEHQAMVRSASSVAEALNAIRALRPDVLVSDISMPGLDGYELMRRIRALDPAAANNIVAIALTAYAREEDRAEALRAGYQVHLVKPVRPDELVEVIARLAHAENAHDRYAASGRLR